MVRKRTTPVKTYEQSTAFSALKLSEPIDKIDLQSLFNILGYRRKANSQSEFDIIRRYIACLPGSVRDSFGNYHIQILKNDGEASKVMWSCHTDTVHSREGRQRLHIDAKGIVKLADGQDKECLGADDGGGIWLMLEMLKRRVPGHYIFHRDEESGRKGSRWVANNLVDQYKLNELDFSIAFDRKAFDSIITYQSGTRCCSNDFADSMAVAMKDSGIKWRKDETGSFTDTASYTEIISECTNLSVGYTGAHGAHEDLDLKHLLMMREALIKFDENLLIAKRNPKVKENRFHNTSSYNQGYGQGQHNYGQGANLYNGMSRYFYTGDDPDLKDRYRISKLISNWALEVAELIQGFGFDADSLFDELFEPKKAPVVVIGGDKKDETKPTTIEQKVETKTISQSLFEDDIPLLPSPTTKATSPAELLAEQVATVNAELIEAAKVRASMSQQGVYNERELDLI